MGPNRNKITESRKHLFGKSDVPECAKQSRKLRKKKRDHQPRKRRVHSSQKHPPHEGLFWEAKWGTEKNGILKWSFVEFWIIRRGENMPRNLCLRFIGSRTALFGLTWILRALTAKHCCYFYGSRTRSRITSSCTDDFSALPSTVHGASSTWQSGKDAVSIVRQNRVASHTTWF
jgi:hypothetical protein